MGPGLGLGHLRHPILATRSLVRAISQRVTAAWEPSTPEGVTGQAGYKAARPQEPRGGGGRGKEPNDKEVKQKNLSCS